MLKQYPRGTGRAHDTGLVCKWLNAELHGIVPGDFDYWLGLQTFLFILVGGALIGEHAFVDLLPKNI